MDVVKIKIGRNEYDIKDAYVRGWITGTSPNDFEQLVRNIIKYGVANIDGKTPEQLAQLEEHQQETIFTELDPIFERHIANKLVASVDSAGVLTLVSE